MGTQQAREKRKQRKLAKKQAAQELNSELDSDGEVADPALMNSRVGKLTKWKPISVKKFISLMQEELAEEQKVPLEQVDFSKLQEQVCTICYCELYEGIATMQEADIERLEAEQKSRAKPVDVVQMSACKGHFFHAECLTNQLGDGQFLACAFCKHFYGVFMGDLPKGSMTISSSSSKVAGYENSEGTWNISYSLKGGTNPKTKASFSSDSRTGYIPMCPEGDEVLALLQMAFERKLVFTVGFSPTRNRDNVICWNGIHHKTSMGGGATAYGFPDETYLARVKEELKLKGCFFQSQLERTAAVIKAKKTKTVHTK